MTYHPPPPPPLSPNLLFTHPVGKWIPGKLWWISPWHFIFQPCPTHTTPKARYMHVHRNCNLEWSCPEDTARPCLQSCCKLSLRASCLPTLYWVTRGRPSLFLLVRIKSLKFSRIIEPWYSIVLFLITRQTVSHFMHKFSSRKYCHPVVSISLFRFLFPFSWSVLSTLQRYHLKE